MTHKPETGSESSAGRVRLLLLWILSVPLPISLLIWVFEGRG